MWGEGLGRRSRGVGGERRQYCKKRMRGKEKGNVEEDCCVLLEQLENKEDKHTLIVYINI